MLLSELMENSYKHHQQIGKLKWARESWRVWKRALLPYLGDIPADTLTTRVQRAYRELRTSHGLKPASINKEFQILRRAYKLGEQHEPPLVDRSPHFEMATLNNARKVFIDLDALQRLRQAAGRHSPWMRLAVEMAFTYGWRRGEILSLRAGDVDLFDGTLRLQTSKNSEAREVPITEDIRPLVESLVRGKDPDQLIFPVRASMFQRYFNEVKKQAGASRYRFHDYRRTSAKAKRAAGVPTSVIMELQGWKTEAMFRRYAIVDRADKTDALRRQKEWEKLKMGVPA